MNRKNRSYRVLQWFHRYLAFFLLVAFVTTCCMMLFVSTLTATLELTLTKENLQAAAKLTFVNVVVLSLLFTVIHTVRRKLTVERYAKQIVEAAEKIMRGDFSVRIRQSGRITADENLQRIAACFNQMAAELGSVETLRTDFIANVSHEMKTPLSVIQNYGALLRLPQLSDEKRLEYAQGVIDSAGRMADRITNILKLNRLENQQIFPQTAEIDLGEQICECLVLFESIWENAGIAIETDIAENVRVLADAELLALVWNNLFSNAFKFTPPGGAVFVRVTADDRHAVVTVRDTGCGMTAEVGSHIFEKFYQGDPSRATQGNGLGLALVKRVIDITKGEISVESAVGEGSAFTVRLDRV